MKKKIFSLVFLIVFAFFIGYLCNGFGKEVEKEIVIQGTYVFQKDLISIDEDKKEYYLSLNGSPSVKGNYSVVNK